MKGWLSLKRIIIICIVCIIISVSSCSASNHLQQPSNPDNTRDSNILSDTDNSISPSINFSEIKADNYYTVGIVASYIKLKPAAMNDNRFSYIDDLLDENSDIYKSEKKYVEDSYAEGIKQKLLSDNYIDIKELGDNKYDVIYTYEIEEKDANNVITYKTFDQVFTVFDDGEVQKILDIRDNQ